MMVISELSLCTLGWLVVLRASVISSLSSCTVIPACWAVVMSVCCACLSASMCLLRSAGSCAVSVTLGGALFVLCCSEVLFWGWLGVSVSSVDVMGVCRLWLRCFVLSGHCWLCFCIDGWCQMYSLS